MQDSSNYFREQGYINFKMKISIVTPSFNQEQFIEDTIRSVLEQDYENIEYIIVDGGSTDGSIDIIRKYEHYYPNRQIQWTSEPDNGQADAINQGWKRCSGDILGWINSDDYYSSNVFSIISQEFQAHPDISIIYGYGQFVTVNGSFVQKIGGPVYAQKMVNGEFYTLPQPSVFIHKRVIDTIGLLDPTYHYALDGEFFIRAFSNFNSLFVPITLASLRLQDQSKSVSSGHKFAPEIVRIAETIVANPHNYRYCAINNKLVVAGGYINGARFLYNNEAYFEAIRYIMKAVSVSPLHLKQIVFRELPRLASHWLLGSDKYNRIGAYISNIKQ